MNSQDHELLTQILGEIRSSWNVDAFVIDPLLLLRKCKELARQMQTLARLLKQPCDATPEKLLALYKRQRGRCAISGVPLTHTPGRREQTSITLDHIIDIRRGESFAAVAAGGKSVGGNAGMIDNVRFICQEMHFIRYRLEDISEAFGDLRARMSVWLELGSPHNDSVIIEQAESFITSREDIERAIDSMTNFGKTRMAARRITSRLTKNGLTFSYTHVLGYIRSLYGCEPKSVEQRERVGVACSFLRDAPDILDVIKTSKTWSNRIIQQYQLLLDAAELPVVCEEAMTEDLCVAYQVLTGKIAPSLEKKSGRSSEFVKNKLKHWSRPTPTNRMQVFSVISSSGRCGIGVNEIHDAVLSRDTLAGVSETYSDAMRTTVEGIIDGIRLARWIDVLDGHCIARLRTHEAATYCGHTLETFRRYHKIGVGPVCEVSSFGGKRSLSFSYEDLDKWIESRKGIRRVCNTAFSNSVEEGGGDPTPSGFLFA